jgi:DNA polymerase III delta prime subunit
MPDLHEALNQAARKGLIRRLRTAYSERKNVLLIGPAGIGKTTVLLQISRETSLQICDDPSSLGCLCDSLEQRLGWNHGKLSLIERKNRLLRYLEQQHEPVAFDHVAMVPPRVARFIAHLAQHIPVWIACRSDQRKEIGHVWEYLYSFSRIDIPPLNLAETSAAIQHAVASGTIQTDAVRHTVDIHHISKGIPRILEQLLLELANRRYRMDRSFGLNLLELDRQISRLPQQLQGPINERGAQIRGKLRAGSTPESCERPGASSERVP